MLPSKEDITVLTISFGIAIIMGVVIFFNIRPPIITKLSPHSTTPPFIVADGDFAPIMPLVLDTTIVLNKSTNETNPFYTVYYARQLQPSSNMKVTEEKPPPKFREVNIYYSGCISDSSGNIIGFLKMDGKTLKVLPDTKLDEGLVVKEITFDEIVIANEIQTNRISFRKSVTFKIPLKQ